MKCLRRWIVVSLFGLIAPPRIGSATPNADNPAKVTHELYRDAFNHQGFSAEIVKSYRPWLTADLYSRLWKEATKPAPVGIEFDVILGGQDAPDRYEIGASRVDQTKAKVFVTVIWPDDKNHFTVLLTQIDGKWKVYDIVYGRVDGSDGGSLSDLLMMK